MQLLLHQKREWEKHDPTLFFEPHPKQKAYLEARDKGLVLFGGNRSGKTEINIIGLKQALDGTNPYRCLMPRADGQDWLVWLGSQDGDIQRDVIQKKFDRYIPKAWIGKKHSIRDQYQDVELLIPNIHFGTMRAKVVFKTYNENVLSWEGASVDYAAMDEEPPEPHFVSMMTRVFDTAWYGNGFWNIAMTPVKGEGWTLDRFYEPWLKGQLEGVSVFEFSTYDNASHLGGEKMVKQLEQSYKEDERSARIYGVATSKQGAVFVEFLPHFYPKGQILKPFKPDWSCFTAYEAMDQGYQVPSSHGFYAVDQNNRKFKYDEIYGKFMTPEQLKAKIWEKRQYYGYAEPYLCVVDPALKRTESNGRSIISQFTSSEPNVYVGQETRPSPMAILNNSKRLLDGKISVVEYERRAKRLEAKEGYISFPLKVCYGNNARFEGFELVNSFLRFDHHTQQPDFFLTSNCYETIREMKRLRWKADRKGMAKENSDVTGDDHACDELRYFCNLNPTYQKGWNPNGISTTKKFTNRRT